MWVCLHGIYFDKKNQNFKTNIKLISIVANKKQNATLRPKIVVMFLFSMFSYFSYVYYCASIKLINLKIQKYLILFLGLYELFSSYKLHKKINIFK